MLEINTWPKWIAVAVVTLAGLVGYEYLYKAPQQKRQQYEGTIVGSSKERHLLKTDRRDPGAVENHTFYLSVKTQAGEVRKVEVDHYTWANAEKGDPVKKSAGERYPKLMTDRAVQRRGGEDIFD
jgi:hypothetical protein